MARYTGPRSKIARRFSTPIFGRCKALQKKNYPPGMHGKNRRRHSEYALQLQEKQKAKYTYGLLERQFSNLFRISFRAQGITGEILLQLLERRLDNVVYRLGIAPTRRAARQLVTHKHVVVNDKLINIPSYRIEEGDRIGVRERSKSLLAIRESVEENNARKYPWLQWDKELLTGVFVQTPTREQIPETIKEQLIVELYSK